MSLVTSSRVRRLLHWGGGTGGTGTYTINNSQTVASETVVSVLPALNDLQVNSNQLPTYFAGNVNLVLI